ncbi:hypothetical protein SAMN05660690_3144 [Geodermatophilus telluris]|uniref:Lipoprotein n=1 Tax=Geodermatophilus telluris TaxID=1190417 RepID=A0A1G6QXR4_9ACTN|nr:hypothetical protein [Geodermatophilus telluris]SDC96993.1 hypothetical protein SAMN05660690_3144 [Geodermatophilus telluris]
MRRRTAPLAVSALLLAAGCTASAGSEDAGSDGGSASVTASAPDQRLTVVADAEPAAAAVSTSRALFDEAGVVVLAPDGDAAATLLGASAAVGLGVPLLLDPEGEGADDAVAAELDRLGAATVLVVGGDAAPGGGDREVVTVPATAEAVGAATGLDLVEADPVPADGEAAAVAELDPDAPAALVPEDGAAGGDGEASGELPEVTRADPLEDTVVLAAGTPESLAGVATARAAGAQVQLTGGSTDPRASADVVDLVAQDPSGTVVALGADFGTEEGLDWKLETAATGAQLPGGGQLLFPQHFMVALYGHPGTGSLGVLGEQDVDASVQRARDTAAPYEALVPDATVVPAFEVIATVASQFPTEEGDYSFEAPVEQLRPWVEAAGEAGLYVVLDLQPGRTDFVTQAERYRELLVLPHVGLALDPEWRLAPDQVHLTQIGSVPVEEVDRVVTWLADLTRENRLPQKLLVLHQFRVDMIPGRENVDLSRDELSVMVHADGQGPQGSKQETWRVLHDVGPAEGLAWGWKNFYDEDQPMLTPEETIAQVSPRPQLVSYQ